MRFFEAVFFHIGTIARDCVKERKTLCRNRDFLRPIYRNSEVLRLALHFFDVSGSDGPKYSGWA